MKKYILVFLAFASFEVFSQSGNDVLNLLISNGTITKAQADSLRAEAAVKEKEAEAVRKSFFASAARPIQIAGYTQMRYQYYEQEDRNHGFDIRRARFDIRGKLTSKFSYRLQTDFAGSPKILDAYAEINLSDYFVITAGQFRIPFSLENLSSMNRFELIDFAQAVNEFTARGTDVIGNHNGRDIGVQIGGTLIKSGDKNLVEYRIGLFNGSGINRTDVNKAKDVVARLIVNPFEGLSIGSSWYNGWAKPASAEVSRTRNRLGFEAQYTLSRLTLRSEYITGTDGEIDKAGWYAWAGYYLIPQKLQAIVKYDSFEHDKSINNSTTTDLVMGLNYNFNSWSRIQAFYTLRQEEGPTVYNDYFSVQYQIGF